MKHKKFKVLFILPVAFIALTACSIPESSKRTAVHKKKASIINKEATADPIEKELPAYYSIKKDLDKTITDSRNRQLEVEKQQMQHLEKLREANQARMKEKLAQQKKNPQLL